jgi:transposase
MIQGEEYTIVMTKNFKYDPKEPYIFFLSDLENAKDILRYYTQRWKIECCFRHLKTNGFNLEDMNLKNDNKIMLMVAVVIITYALAIKEGALKYMQKQIGLKRYKNGKVYLEMSIFRKGLEVLDGMLNGLNRFIWYLLYQIKHGSKYPCLLVLNKIVQ